MWQTKCHNHDKKNNNGLNYNYVYLNLALVGDRVCIQQGRKGQYDGLLRCGQIFTTKTAVKRQTIKPPDVTLFIAVHNCTILHNAVPIAAVLRYIFEQLLLCVYFILSLFNSSVTQNINSRKSAVGRSGARILKRTRDSFHPQTPQRLWDP
jgi:hypothetical protein